MGYDIDTRKDLKVYHKEIQTDADINKVDVLKQISINDNFIKKTTTISLLNGYDISAHNIAIGSIDTRVSILYGGPESQVSSADSVFIDSLATNYWSGISI